MGDIERVQRIAPLSPAETPIQRVANQERRQGSRHDAPKQQQEDVLELHEEEVAPERPHAVRDLVEAPNRLDLSA